MAEDTKLQSQNDNDDGIVLDRDFENSNISEATDVDPDGSTYTAPEKSDVYFENLEEEILAQAEMEAEAELALVEKRKKDKKRAREKDKRAFRAAHEKHEQDIAEENQRRAMKEELSYRDSENNQKAQTAPDSTTDAPVSTTPQQSDLYDSSSNQLDSLQNSITPLSEVSDSPYSDESAAPEFTNEPYGGENPRLNNASVKPYEPAPAHESQDRQGYPSAFTEAEKHRKELVENVLVEQQKKQDLQNEALLEKLNQDAIARQICAENYKSFGNEGIDYSGNNQHSAYLLAPEGAAIPVIDEGKYNTLRTDYENSRMLFKSFGDHVPDSVSAQYQEATDNFFAVQRQIDQGLLIVAKVPENPIPVSLPSLSTYSGSETPLGGLDHPLRDKRIVQPSSTSTSLSPAGADAPERVSVPSDPPALRYSNFPSTFVNGVHFTDQVMLQYAKTTYDRARNLPDELPDCSNSNNGYLPFKNVSPANSEVLLPIKPDGATLLPGVQENRNVLHDVRFPHNIRFGSEKADTLSPRDSAGNAGEAAAATVNTISRARYDALQAKYVASQKEVASFHGQKVPQAVSEKAEKINRLQASIQGKINNGSLIVVNDVNHSRSQSGSDPAPSKSRTQMKGANSVGTAPNARSFAQGSQAFYHTSPMNYGSDTRYGKDRRKRPPDTPFHKSPIGNYDKLKIYHTANLTKPIEVATSRIWKAAGFAVLAAARSEQTGTANTMMSAQERAREAVYTWRTLKAAPRLIKATAQQVGTVAHGARNVVRFIEGKELLEKKQRTPLTIRQLDKEFHKPFTSSEKAKMQKKFGTASNHSISQTKNRVILQTANSKNLKSDIKALQAKGAALTADERKQLKALMDQKKLADQKLRKTHGLKAAQEKAAVRNSRADRLSQKSTKKTIKKTEKKKLRLSKKESLQIVRMKDKLDFLEKRKKFQKAAFARKNLAMSIGSVLGRAMRESEQSGVQGVLTASRVVQNRYVRSILKISTKAALMPARLAAKPVKFAARKVDAKLGISNAVKTVITKAEEAVVQKVIHSRVYRGIHGEWYQSARSKISSALPSRIRTRVTNGAEKLRTLNSKRKAVLDKYNKLKRRLKESKVGKFVTSISKGFKKISAGFQFAKKLLVKIAISCGALLIIIALIGSFITAIGGVAGGLVLSEDSQDGKISLEYYIDTLNTEQRKINRKVNTHLNNTEDNGGKYKRVYVDYVGSANGNNYKEIISMAAVYFDQDLSNTNAVTEYITGLFKASNYVKTSESQKYYCSGCKERHYKCYDVPDQYATDTRKTLYANSDHSDYPLVGKGNAYGCKYVEYSCMEYGHGTFNIFGCWKHNDGKEMEAPGDCDHYKVEESRVWTESNGILSEEIVYTYVCIGHCSGNHRDYYCPGHTETVCFGHIDLYVDVACLGFNEIFAVDPGMTAGVDYGDYAKGSYLGTFNITYYCAEKYPHICNAGPPYQTASGTEVTAGRTIAVDPDVIPLGTPVIINGHVYIAEDTGGAIKGNRIDIAVESHQEALNLGRNVFKVYKAKPAEAEDTETSQRRVIDYYSLAYESASTVLSPEQKLYCFGAAKNPEVVKANANYIIDLQNFDTEHINEPFTNVELNAFRYVEMPLDKLQALANERNLKDEYNYGAYYIIRMLLIPYDKEHPDLYVDPADDPSSGNVSSFNFAGWVPENQNWAKEIFANMDSDIYAGLDKIVGNKGSQNDIPLDGLVIQGSKINVTYYSQHDPRWGDWPIRSDSPENTISKAGCGFTSMAIVVSSLTSNKIDPPGMCDLYGKTHYAIGQGAYHSLIPDVSANYGLSCTELRNTDMQGVIDALKQGKLVVALVGRGGYGWTGNGYYTGYGHFLVICGVTEDGALLLADPDRPDISAAGKAVTIDYFIASGIKKFWTIGAS